jgi:hypothetical protein
MSASEETMPNSKSCGMKTITGNAIQFPAIKGAAVQSITSNPLSVKPGRFPCLHVETQIRDNMPVLPYPEDNIIET